MSAAKGKEGIVVVIVEMLLHQSPVKSLTLKTGVTERRLLLKDELQN